MTTSQKTPLASKPSSDRESRPGFRTKTIATRITPEELAEIESAAEGDGKALAEWLRETALNAARRPASDSVQLLVAEIWAVRYALLNLFRAGTQANLEGKPMSPELVAQIREEADSRKLQQARSIIEGFIRSGEPNRRV